MASAAWAEGAGGEDVDCRVEWQLPTRVVTLDVHPTRPLVALGLPDGLLQVWDYSQGARVFEWNGQIEAEEEAVEHGAQDLLQKMADWKGPREEGAAASAAALEKIRFGAARLVRFIDDDVRHWTARRMAANTSTSSLLSTSASSFVAQPSGGGGGIPTSVSTAGIDKTRSEASPSSPRGHRSAAAEKHVLYAGEAWAALVSYAGGRTRRFETEKSVSAVEWVARLGCLAMGHVDGTVRLADPDAPGAAVDSTRTVKAHTRPVARLVSYELKGEPMLLSAGQDGCVCVWALSAPLADEKKDKERGTANPMRYKIHSSDGLTASGLVLSDEMLYTAGADKQVCVWDVRNAKEVLRTRTLRSAALVACEPLSHPRFAPGSCLVAAGGEHKARIMVAEVRAEEGGAKDKKKDEEALRIKDIANTGDLWVRAGKKKGPRVLGLWLHPFQNHLFFVATKAGLILASIEQHRSPAFAQTEPIARPLTLYTLPDERLLSIVGSVRAVFAGLSIEKEGRKVKVMGSPSGRMLLVHAWDTGRYAVYPSSAPFTQLAEGYARSVAWGPGDGLMVLELKAGQSTDNSDAKKKKKDKEKGPTEKPPPRIVVHWHEVVTNAATDLSTVLKNADRVHSGQLLGIETEVDGGASTLQLYAWTTWLPVGSPLPAPLLLKWHPREPLLLLAYRTYSLIARLGPTCLSVLCFIPRIISSALWYHQALLYATATSIEMFFPSRMPSPPILLASFRPVDLPSTPLTSSPSLSPSNSANSPAAASASSPPPRKQALFGTVSARPQGSVSLICIHEEALWLLECSEDRLSSVPLSSASCRTLLHIAARQTDKALAAAAQVQACHHRALAAILLSLDALRDALRMPYLTAQERLELCRMAKLHDDAPDVLSACAAKDAGAEEDEASKRDAASGTSPLAMAALSLARAADLGGAYRKSLALYREALRISPESFRPMVAFYVRNNKLKKLASLQKKQQANNKAEEAAFSGLFLEGDAFSSPLLNAHAPLYHTATGTSPAALLKVKWGSLPEVSLLPPEQDIF